MCRKLILLTSFVLVVGFVNNANAADIVWTGNGADNLWSNPANWEGNKVPTAADDVAIEVPGAAAPNGPLIQDGIDAECGVLWNEVAGEPTMTMTGGTLTISGWGIWWGDGPGCNPTFNMSGGTVSLTGGTGIHEFGWGGANGTWIMTGGTVNAKGAMLSTDPGNTGEIYLHGGTYNVGTSRADRDDRFGGGLVLNDGGLIDIGEGTLVLDILEGQESRYIQYINDLIDAGQITAFGGAGKFEMDFDVRNPGMITATAVELKIAYNPDPADGSYYSGTSADLNWSSPDVAAWHNVYFGDNFDDVKNGTGGTAQGQQVETFFAVSDLVPGTTYYWRIDVVEADVTTIHEGDVWSFTIPPRTAYDPNPADGAESIDPNVELSWTGGFGAILHTVYFGDNFDEVSSAADGVPQPNTTYSPLSTLELEKVYYWRVDEFDASETYTGDVWSFTTPGAVGSPSPSNGATGVNMTATLSWNPGDSAASHQLYLGTDKDAVRNADTASPEYIGTMNLGSESYDPPGKLAWFTTYYWRVDEVNNVNPNSPWKGPLWSFTTGDFVVVDDFESYNDLDPNDPGSNRIFSTWQDGYGDTANGSEIGYLMPPLLETDIVHGGAQSMPYSYDNDLKYSEASRPLNSQSDWTEEGVGVLSLWFRGDASNAAERMYVAVSNAGGTPAVVPHDDPNAAQINIWTEWTIDLTDFSDQGVDLANLDTFAIGFGDKDNLQAGGSGKVYFDDIRLYRRELVGWWKLDDNASDSSGNGHDGTLSADPVPVWTTDPERGNVLEFVPGLDYVDCGPGVGAGQDLTVALWIKPADVDLMRPISCFDGDDYSVNPGWFLMLRHDDWGEPPQIPPNAWFRMTGTEGEWNSGDLWINECWAPGEWVHMAFTFDEATDTLSGYINGQLAGVTVVPEGRGVASDTNPLIMGHGGVEEYQGLMDDVYIYNVVLTEAEISNLAAEPAG